MGQGGLKRSVVVLAQESLVLAAEFDRCTDEITLHDPVARYWGGAGVNLSPGVFC